MKIKTVVMLAAFGFAGLLAEQHAYSQFTQDTSQVGGEGSLDTGTLQPDFGLSGFGAGAQQTSILDSAPTAQNNRAINSAIGGFGAGLGLGGFGGGFGGFGGGFGGFGGGFGNSQQNQSPIKVSLKLGFKGKWLAPEQVKQNITSRLDRIPLPQKFRALDLAIDKRTATVKGNVPFRRDAKIVEQLLLLEPGIDKVENQIVWEKEEESFETPFE